MSWRNIRLNIPAYEDRAKITSILAENGYSVQVAKRQHSFPYPDKYSYFVYVRVPYGDILEKEDSDEVSD